MTSDYFILNGTDGHSAVQYFSDQGHVIPCDYMCHSLTEFLSSFIMGVKHDPITSTYAVDIPDSFFYKLSKEANAGGLSYKQFIDGAIENVIIRYYLEQEIAEKEGAPRPIPFYSEEYRDLVYGPDFQ